MGVFVPQTMKNKKRWILWRLEDGKKVPYSVYYDGKASSTRSNTWAYFSQALEKSKYGDFDGLGYVFTAEDGLVFIDLDNCVSDAGEINDFAKQILEIFPDTYTEYSQSGNGLHLVVKGTLPRAYKSPQIEVYSSGRYMAFTGDVLEDKEPREAQESLQELVKLIESLCTTEKACESVDTTATTFYAPPQSDIGIVTRAESGRAGDQFKELWAGNWESYYKSQSEADMRLVGLLVYYGASDEQVHRLFLSSALGQRAKATEAYIQRMVDRARMSTKPLHTPQNSLKRGRRAGLTDTPKQKKNNRRL